MGGSPKRPIAGEQIVKAEWVAKAVRLAVKGWSLRRIAEQVKRHHTTVAEALKGEFERVRPSKEEIEMARSVHREKLLRRESRLNQLILAHWPLAKGDVDHAKVVVDADKGLDKVHISLAKLDGLDAPSRRELTGKDGEPLVPVDMSKLTDAQLERLLAGDADAIAVGDSADDSGGGEAGESPPAGTREPAGDR